MGKAPKEDPRVTDLRAYRKAREQAQRRREPQATRPQGQSILGSNPRAGLILAIVVAVLAALYWIPRLL
jgi:hypothetical protein